MFHFYTHVAIELQNYLPNKCQILENTCKFVKSTSRSKILEHKCKTKDLQFIFTYI